MSCSSDSCVAMAPPLNASIFYDESNFQAENYDAYPIDYNYSMFNMSDFPFRRRITNITEIYPIQYAMPMYGYVMPFLLVITIIANTLIVVVLSKRHMRTPTNLVLMAMALSDMFTMLFPAPWFFYFYTLGNHRKPLFPMALCYSFRIMHDLLPSVFHTASIWLTLALAIQRYVYVCHAHVARTWCTVSRVKKGIVWIYIFSTLHQSTRCFDTVYYPVEIVWNNRTIEACSADEIAPWVTDIQNIYFNIYFWFRVIFVHTAPCSTLIVLNCLLFSALRQAQLKRKKLFKENRKSECKKLRDSNCTTLMLIVVVTVFLIVEVPLALLTLLHIIQNTFDKIKFLDYKMAFIMILFTNFFIMLSYPINFAIYCGMSRQFRETFKDLFIHGVGSSRRENSSRYSVANGPRSTNETVL